MGNVVVIGILAVIMIYAIKEDVKHLKGQGDCCGGGGEDIPVAFEKKELQGPVIGTKTVHIEGMHCDKCKARVERAINRIDGAAAVVDLKNHTATVSMDRPISDDMIRNAVSLQDYKVLSIE